MSDDDYLLIHPNSVLTWSHNWADWLDYSSPVDAIASRQWTIAPENDSSSPSTPTLTSSTQEIVTAEGFVAGRVYRLSEHIVTNAGLEDTRTIVLRCEE
jgi:hypothetical protein